MNKKDIDPTDKHGKFHGYQEWYWESGKLMSRCKWIHGIKIGYHEYHSAKRTNFIIR